MYSILFTEGPEGDPLNLSHLEVGDDDAHELLSQLRHLADHTRLILDLETRLMFQLILGTSVFVFT